MLLLLGVDALDSNGRIPRADGDCYCALLAQMCKSVQAWQGTATALDHGRDRAVVEAGVNY